MSVETLAYRVVNTYSGFEVRQYDDYLVAEITLDGSFGGVGNVAFSRLAGYIFGRNQSNDKVAMTAPVIQQPAAEKIAMTAPVIQHADADTWVVAFVMPAAYTMETLPQPLDPKVRLRQRPGQLMAALTYRGTWHKGTYDKKLRQLRHGLTTNHYREIGQPYFARYNPPYTLWFLRRNEILIPIEVVTEQD